MTLSLLRIKALLCFSLLLSGGCATAAVPPAGDSDEASYRVYDVAARRFVAISSLAAATDAADVVFFGEYHDSEGAHQAQRDLLELVAGGAREAVLGFEMFERDVQPMIDHYLAGMIDEAAFLANSRPWPNYGTDYKPLVETARSQGWRVLATNLPQSLASRVAREGLGALGSATPEERRMAPQGTITCPLDQYWENFVEAITGEESDSSSAHTTAADALQNIFQAQCARDAAMAEVVAPLITDESVLIHFNGAFHTDHFLGLTNRVAATRPDARVVVVSTVGVENPARPDLDEHLDRADFLIVVQEDPE